MNIAIFGLGYVGTTSMACFARDGHRVTGVDVNPEKVNAIAEGKSPIVEPGLAEILKDCVEKGLIATTVDAAEALKNAEIAMICVGTPSKSNGDLEIKYLERVCHDIGQALTRQDKYLVVAVRSTVLPGTAETRLIPILEAESNRLVGKDLGFCINPEFLREGSAIADFDHPPYTLIGQSDERSGEPVVQLYANVTAPVYQLPLGAAEMVKYASNAFHALKIVFANEIGNICQTHGIDSHEVMRVFVNDTKLNLSPYYLKPGFSFGGSCLGKDLRALLYDSRRNDVRTPVLESILLSNELHTHKALQILVDEGKRKIALIGLSFKSNTDDLRESPAVELAERLIGKGFELRIFDHEVSLSHLHGSNREYIDRVIPHMASLLRPSLADTVNDSEAIVVTKHLGDSDRNELIALLRPDQMVIDLVRLDQQTLRDFTGEYRGIAW